MIPDNTSRQTDAEQSRERQSVRYMLAGLATADLSFTIRFTMICVAVVLVQSGISGLSHVSVGYAFFLIATLLLGAGILLFGTFSLTDRFDTRQLRRAYGSAFWMGAWSYVWAVSALSGYYIHEAISGLVEWKYVIFGPSALFAIVVFDVGIWHLIVKRNLPTVHRFGELWQRDTLDKQALRRALVDEVILHRTLSRVSPFRWVRHQLVFWGFGLMFTIEIIAVFFREAFPAFGWADIWQIPGHPVRLAFDIAYDLTGMMIVVGCILALIFRVMVNGQDDQKYTDTPTAMFLLFLAGSGFILEGIRLNNLSATEYVWASPIGLLFSYVLPSGVTAHDTVWIVHAVAACAFIAYVPLKRMIHSCATPIGRLANSQISLLAKKKARVFSGLMRSTD